MSQTWWLVLWLANAALMCYHMVATPMDMRDRKVGFATWHLFWALWGVYICIKYFDKAFGITVLDAVMRGLTN